MDVSKGAAIRMINLARNIERDAAKAQKWVKEHGQLNAGWNSACRASDNAVWDSQSLINELLHAFVGGGTVCNPVRPVEVPNVL